MHKTLIISAIFQFGAVSFASGGAQVSQPGNYNCTVMCQECGDNPTCARMKLDGQDRDVHFCPPSEARSEPAKCWGMPPELSREISRFLGTCIVGSAAITVAVVLPLIMWRLSDVTAKFLGVN
ncbi:MAG: hypothetical protein HYW48_12565 [Deltaproteobacteria bacterium]|nr:hypothetical protein [Deltaproteobacteria bacterium]